MGITRQTGETKVTRLWELEHGLMIRDGVFASTYFPTRAIICSSSIHPGRVALGSDTASVLSSVASLSLPTSISISVVLFSFSCLPESEPRSFLLRPHPPLQPTHPVSHGPLTKQASNETPMKPTLALPL